MSETQVYTLSLRDMFTKGVNDATSAASGLKSVMAEVAIAVGAAFALDRIIEFGKEVMHTTTEFESFRNVIKFSSTDMEDGQANLDYLAGAVDRLNMPMKEAYENFSSLQAGLMGTGIEGQKLRDVFEGIGTASAVLHLDKDRFSRLGYALQEVGDLGTLQSRQYRMIAMAMPGGGKLIAEALGMTPKKLKEEMEKGTIEAGPFMEKFGAELKKHFNAGLHNASESLISKQIKAENEFLKLQLEIGNDLRPMYIQLLNAVIEFYHALKDAWHWLKEHRDVLEALGVAVGTMIGLWSTYQVLVNGVTWATNLWTGAQWLLNAAMDANPIGILIVGIGALVGWIYYAWNHAEKFRATILGLWEVIKVWAKDFEAILGGLWQVIHGIFTMNSAEVTQGLYSIVSTYAKAGTDAATAWKAGFDSGLSDIGNPINGGTLIQPPDMKGKHRTFKGKNKEGEGTTPSDATDQAKAVGSKAVTVNIKIDNLVKEFKIHTTNIQESAQKAKEYVAQALLSAVNDSQIVAGQ